MKNTFLQKLSKHAPTILTIVGTAGVVGTSVLTAKATIKAAELVNNAKEEKGGELEPIEMVQVAAPAYIPAVAVGVATITCMIGANILNKRNQASLLSAYMLLETAYKSFKNKTTELYGNEAAMAVRQVLAREKYEHVDAEDDGKQLFYEAYSERYFRSTIEQVKMAEFELSSKIVEKSEVSLNDFYDILGLEQVDYGNDIGWIDAPWEGKVEFEYDYTTMDDGLECIIITIPEPSLDYRKF